MKLFRPILSIALASLVLLSSTSFMVGIHVCGGEVQNVALFTKAESCEKEKSLPPCHRHEQSPCCDDETVIHDGEDFNASFEKITVSPVFFVDVVQAHVLIADIIPATFLSKVKHFNYDAPLRATDLTVSLQVFLI